MYQVKKYRFGLLINEHVIVTKTVDIKKKRLHSTTLHGMGLFRVAVLALELNCLITITHTPLALELRVFHLAQMFFKKATIFLRGPQTLCVCLEMRLSAFLYFRTSTKRFS